jgi:type IV secretion system protein VirB7
MRWMIAVALVGALVSGCASMRYPLASCDGGEKRPLNKGQWAHEKRADLGTTSSKCRRA